MFEIFLSGSRLVKKLRDKKGMELLEFAMFAGGIIFVLVLIVTLFGDQIMSMFEGITDAMNVRDTGAGSW